MPAVGDYDELPTRGRYKEAEPAVINNAGQIAGQLFGYDLETGWSGEVPVLWSADNVLTLLPMPTGYDHATIEDIDEDGTVLGKVRDLESDRRAPLPLDLPLRDERRYGDTLIRIHDPR